MDENIIVFTHIMKTAGRSLNEFFKETFGKERVIEIYEKRTTMWDFIKMKRSKTINCICGHVDFGIHELLGIGNVQYITFLREPIRRIVSEYYYLRDKSKSHPYHDAVVKAGSVEGWFRNPQRCRNIQSHRICGWNMETNLQNAVGNLLMNYAFFGITEYMDESIRRLCSEFALENKFASHNNKGEYQTLDKQAYDKLKEQFYEEDLIDNSLYEIALHTFNKLA